MIGYQAFNAFIETERHRFEAEHHNTFAAAFWQVLRYHDFCRRTLERHRRTSDEFVGLIEQTRKLAAMPEQSKESRQEYTRASLARNDRATELGLEIESFYIFAKMMLDRAAQAVRFYFGGHNAPPLESHHALVDNLEEYCRLRNLQSEQPLLVIAQRLRGQISDIRDYQIVHDANPRSERPFTWTSARDIRMQVTKLYPKVNEGSVQLTPLDELRSELDSYLGCLADFLSVNRDKTNLKLNQTFLGA
jgi:hypothetical protein